MDKAIKYKLSVVIPVYNSQETIGALIDQLTEILIKYDYEIILIDDYSKDKSREICLSKCKKYAGRVKYHMLSKNFSEHNAVIAGLNCAEGDYAVIMDDDFQNPPEEIPRMIESMINNRFDVLYTYYEEKKHNWFRNFGSWFNNKVAAFLLKLPKGLYLSSFKCINRFIINEIIKYRGPYPYIDGLIMRATGNFGTIAVLHQSRKHGHSNYTLRKLMALWLNMFINFSVVPLRVSFLTGFLMAILGMFMIFYFLLDMYVFHSQGPWPAGWFSLITSVVVFSGAQLMFIGLVGEYIGRLFLTENGTPQYVIRESRGVSEKDG